MHPKHIGLKMPHKMVNPQKYKSSDVAPGEYIGKLVFKVWGGINIIQCFFVLKNNEFIRLSAFRPHATPWRGYTPRDGKVDFSKARIEGKRYKITTGLTERGVVSFLSARAIYQKTCIKGLIND